MHLRQSTAQRSGLIHVNDVLHAVGDVSVYHLSVAETRALIIGDPDSEVDLWITPGPRQQALYDGTQRPHSLPNPSESTSPSSSDNDVGLLDGRPTSLAGAGPKR